MKTKYLLSLLILISLLFTNQSIAQSNKLVIEKMKIPDHQSMKVYSNEKYNSYAINPGDELFNTKVDYMCNNAIGPQIDLFDIDGDGTLDPIMTQMQLLSIPTNRSQQFVYKAFGSAPENFSAFDPTNGTSGSSTYGGGSIQLCVGGNWDGNALLFAHSNGQSWHSRIDLTNLVPITPYPTTSIPGSFPSFVYLQSGRIIVNNATFIYYSSMDYGETFDSLFMFGDNDPNFIINTYTPAEIPIFKSDDDTVIASVGGFEGCFPIGNPDGLYWYGSTDAGSTWFGYAFGYGSGTHPEYGQITNRDYAPYFSNFAQINYNVSNDGVTHLVANGYGQGILPGTSDTVNVFPILYWNSNHQNWIAITDPSTEGPTDGFGHFVSGPAVGQRLYSGNGIGQAYPNVSTSDDGRVVFVAWQGFEYTGAVGSSEWNIYPGDGSSNSGPIYYTDLYYAYSNDYGVTWADPSILKGDANVMEQFPYLARRIEFFETQAKVNYIYQEDAIPGCSIFNGQIAGQNSSSDETRWLYDYWESPAPPPPSVEDDISLNEFTLEQNYPNPFNPSTKISWQSAVGSWQTLKVYDMLGNEVATIVNEYRPAGKYEIEFIVGQDSNPDIASGVYFYQLLVSALQSKDGKAGSFIQTKKMVLLK